MKFPRLFSSARSVNASGESPRDALHEPTASRVAPHSEALLKEAIRKLLEPD